MSGPITSIKVPAHLRDRISAHARARGITVAEFLNGVLDQWERERRMNAMKYAIQRTSPEEMANYLREVESMAGTLMDGFEDEGPLEEWIVQ